MGGAGGMDGEQDLPGDGGGGVMALVGAVPELGADPEPDDLLLGGADPELGAGPEFVTRQTVVVRLCECKLWP